MRVLSPFLLVLATVSSRAGDAPGSGMVTVKVLDRFPHGAPDEIRSGYARAIKEGKVWWAEDKEARASATMESTFRKDGKDDVWEVYSASGELLERRTDNLPWHAPDGKVDETEFYSQGKLALRIRRVGCHAMRPPHAFYQSGVALDLFHDGLLVVQEHDNNLDGLYEGRQLRLKGDRWNYVGEGDLHGSGAPSRWGVMLNKMAPRTEEDRNRDGRVDHIVVRPRSLFHDHTEYLDEDYDGTFDTIIFQRYDRRTKPITEPTETTRRAITKDDAVPTPLFPGQPADALRACGATAVSGMVTLKTHNRYPHGAPKEARSEYRKSLDEGNVWWSIYATMPTFAKDKKDDVWEVYSASGELLQRRIDNRPWHAPDGKVDVTEFYSRGMLLVRFTIISSDKAPKPHAVIDLFYEGVLVESQRDMDMDGVYESCVLISSAKANRENAPPRQPTNGDPTLDNHASSAGN